MSAITIPDSEPFDAILDALERRIMDERTEYDRLLIMARSGRTPGVRARALFELAVKAHFEREERELLNADERAYVEYAAALELAKGRFDESSIDPHDEHESEVQRNLRRVYERNREREDELARRSLAAKRQAVAALRECLEIEGSSPDFMPPYDPVNLTVGDLRSLLLIAEDALAEADLK